MTLWPAAHQIEHRAPHYRASKRRTSIPPHSAEAIGVDLHEPIGTSRTSRAKPLEARAPWQKTNYRPLAFSNGYGRRIAPDEKHQHRHGGLLSDQPPKILTGGSPPDESCCVAAIRTRAGFGAISGSRSGFSDGIGRSRRSRKQRAAVGFRCRYWQQWPFFTRSVTPQEADHARWPTAPNRQMSGSSEPQPTMLPRIHLDHRHPVH